MEKLPILISVPHGGDEIPPELHTRIALNKKEIFDDSDALTREIYNFKNEVFAFIDTPIARACVDLNRAPNNRPPTYPDGIVKTETVNRCAVYKPGKFPDKFLIEQLLNNYYYPFHNVLDALQDNKHIRLALDCHSMLAKSPPISQVPGLERPIICLSNRGDQSGFPKNETEPITCSPEMIQQLAKVFRQVFDCKKNDVKINEPFAGGHIIRYHYKGNIPWVQVEINRKLYLSPKYFDVDNLTVTSERIAELRNKILTALKMLLSKI